MAKVKLSKKRKEEIMREFGGKMPTKEDILEKILQSQQRMAESLKGAWENAPDDPEIKKQLLEVGERSMKLKKKIEKVLKE